MKKIHIVITNQGNIWVVSKPTEIYQLLLGGEEIVKTYYQKTSIELQNFLSKHPEVKDYFLKGFAYWVICKVKNIPINHNQYGMLKRKLHEYSKKLFRSIRNLANKIGSLIQKYTQ